MKCRHCILTLGPLGPLHHSVCIHIARNQWNRRHICDIVLSLRSPLFFLPAPATAAPVPVPVLEWLFFEIRILALKWAFRHNRWDWHVEPSRSNVGSASREPSISVSALELPRFLNKRVIYAKTVRLSRSGVYAARQCCRIRLKLGEIIRLCSGYNRIVLFGAPAIRRRERFPDTWLP